MKKSLVSGASAYDLIERMKAVSGVKTDAALARMLDISGAAISRWKTNGSVPIEYCIRIAEKCSSSLDYIYRGTILDNKKQSNVHGSIDIDIDILKIVIRYEWPDNDDNASLAAAESIANKYINAEKVLGNLVETVGLDRNAALSAIDAFLHQDRFALVRQRRK